MRPAAYPKGSRAVRQGMGSRRRFLSVGTKLTGAMLVIMTVMTMLATVVVTAKEREEVYASKGRASTMVTDLFVAGVTASVAFADDAGVNEHLVHLMADARVTYSVVWRFDTIDGIRYGEKVAEKGRLATAPPLPDLEPGVTLTQTSEAIVVDEAIRTSTGEIVGFVRVAFSLREENAAVAAAARRTIATAALSAIGMSLVLLFLSRTLIVRRLADLGRAARDFENGKAVEIKIGTNDEVAELARAFASMTGAIKTRENRISQRNRDMRRVLDNVTEGLMTVQRDGRISEDRSRILDTWFGAPSGPDVIAYFERFAPTTARLLKLGFLALEDDIMPVEVILDQMPKDFQRGQAFFELDVLPIWRDVEESCLDQLLFVVRDVTSRYERRRAEQAQRESLNIFRRFLDDRHAFRMFFADASALVERLGTIDAATTLRDIHTLKGNASLYELESVAEVCHELETLAIEDGARLATLSLEELERTWKQVKDIVDLIDRSREERIELSVEEHAHHVEALVASHARAELVEQASSWRAELASNRLRSVTEQARSIARRLGKGDATIHTSVSPPDLRLPAGRWSPFWQVFPHVLRNIFDHGIALPATRMMAGKTPGGNVAIAISQTSAHVELRVSDDGDGIQWEQVRARATALGLPHENQHDLVEALCADRLSTRTTVTEMSGRGVGMAAVRETVRACGGTLEVESTPGVGATFIFRFPLGILAPNASTFPSRAA